MFVLRRTTIALYKDEVPSTPAWTGGVGRNIIIVVFIRDGYYMMFSQDAVTGKRIDGYWTETKDEMFDYLERVHAVDKLE